MEVQRTALRVLMLSKACIVGAYQRKLEEMVAYEPSLDLTVAVPAYWRDERGRTRLDEAHTTGYQLRVVPLAFNGQFHLHFYPTVGRLLGEISPDIVHIDEEPYNLATFHANRVARRAGAKTVWFSWQNLNRRYPFPFSWMERFNLQHTDYALVGSQSAAEVWRAKGYQNALAIVPQFGVDPQIFSPPSARPAGRPVHISYVGRLVPEKGIDTLLRALAELEGDWRATLLGSGPEEASLRRQITNLALDRRVTLLPPIPSVDMPTFYREADILVLPSRARSNWTEQFGRVLIEAMACEVAVVGSDCGEIPHVLGDAGLVFPQNDADALRQALGTLLREAPRKALATHGRDRVLTRFTQRQVAEDTVRVYREMLA